MIALTGSLLISNVNLLDRNFRRTVVLIGHHDVDGAVGVVLNQPLGVTVREAVPPLGGLVDVGERLFDGGPVEPASVVVLADFIDPTRAELIALDTIGFLPPVADDDVGAAIRRARVYAGYAGWDRASSRTSSPSRAGSSHQRCPTTSSTRSRLASGKTCSAGSVATTTCCASCLAIRR